jgi:RNA polymerase sigma factor (sigma-70 family)
MSSGEARSEPRPTGEPIETVLAAVRPTLARIFRRFRIPPDESEDLLQNCLLSWVSHRSSIANERAWLVGAARLQCLQYWRRRRRRLYDAMDTSFLEILAPATGPDQERRQLRRDLTTTVALLPARCRNILRLRYALDCERAEMALRLGCQKSSVSKITSRCLSALALSFLGGRPKESRHERTAPGP